MDRDEAKHFILSCGGCVSASVAKKVTHALVGQDAGQSKMLEIRERSLPILDEAGLFLLCRVLSGERVQHQKVEKLPYISDEEFEIDDDDDLEE
jgi:BRCT domain type II-containing protein